MAEEVVLNFDDFASILTTLMENRSIQRSELVYKYAIQKQIGLAGAVANIEKYLNNKSQPSLFSLKYLMEVFEYDVILIPRENKKNEK